jgi:hypothetical protein
MLIKYKPKVEHIKTIPLIPDPANPKSYARSQVMLLPGTNEVTDDEWEAIKPHVTAEISAGEIAAFTVKAGAKGGEEGGRARNLVDVPVRVALEIVEKCVNPATLKKWFAEESREAVLLAVTKRMRKFKLDPEEIEKENEAKKDESDLDDKIEEEAGGDKPLKPLKKKGGKGKGDKTKKTDAAETAEADEGDDIEDDDDDIPDFDNPAGAGA